MRGISNWCGENFIGWWAADFQIYVLRFPSAKHSDEPLKAGIVLTFFLGRWCHNLIYPLTQKYRRIRSHFQCGGFFSYSTAFTAADIFSSFCFEKYSFVSQMITFLSAMIAIRFGIIINAFVISARSQIGSSDKNGASAIAAM